MSMEKTALQINVELGGGCVVVALLILLSAKVQNLWDFRLETLDLDFGLTIN